MRARDRGCLSWGPLLPPVLRLLSIFCVVGVTANGLGAAGDDLRILSVVREGNVAAVRALLRAGGNVNVKEGDGTSALHLAAARADHEMTRALLQAGAAVNAENDLGITPLLVASSTGSPALVSVLAEAGANPNAATSTGVTSLMFASRLGDLASVKTLLTRGANVNASESARGQTALMWAVVNRHPDIVKALLAAGADPHVHSKTYTRWVRACCEEYNPDPGVPFMGQFGGFTALMFAAQQGDVASARSLLAAGAKLEDTAADGATPLAIAAFLGHGALVTFLLEQGANPNADGGGYAPLHAAVLTEMPEIAKTLFRHGANPNVRLTKPTIQRTAAQDYAFNRRWIGATPFSLAVAFHDLKFMELLLAGGADPRLTRTDGSTPVMVAIGGKKDVNWDPELRRDYTHSGAVWRPIDGVEQATLNTVKFLVELGADLDATDDEGNTVLHRAATLRYVTVAKLLLEGGANINPKNNKGLTPLGIALAPRKLPSGSIDHEGLQVVLNLIEEPRERLVALLREAGGRE